MVQYIQFLRNETFQRRYFYDVIKSRRQIYAVFKFLAIETNARNRHLVDNMCSCSEEVSPRFNKIFNVAASMTDVTSFIEIEPVLKSLEHRTQNGKAAI